MLENFRSFARAVEFGSFSEAGRQLREKGAHMNLMAATGLKADEFARLQKSVVALRDNLIEATAQQEK